MRFAVLFVVFAAPLLAVQIPAGAELNIRLTDKVASETTAAHSAIHAVLASPVAVNGAVALPLGATLSGEVTKVSAANFADGATVVNSKFAPWELKQVPRRIELFIATTPAVVVTVDSIDAPKI